MIVTKEDLEPHVKKLLEPKLERHLLLNTLMQVAHNYYNRGRRDGARDFCDRLYSQWEENETTKY